MTTVIPVSKRGTVTLPPDVRKKLGLDRLENPMLLLEERNGELVLAPATAVPVRDLPQNVIEQWIREDEAEMDAFRKAKETPKK